jgi:uncharacterized protein with FMN-binding domain
MASGERVKTSSVLWAGASLSLLTACASGGSDASSAPVVPTVPGDVAYADGVYVGPRVTNIKGGYQAQVTIDNGIITKVEPIEAGTQEPESLQVNAVAVPELIKRVLVAQSADVDYVSGSSFTSPAFLESIDGALNEAAQGEAAGS